MVYNKSEFELVRSMLQDLQRRVKYTSELLHGNSATVLYADLIMVIEVLVDLVETYYKKFPPKKK